MDRSITYCTNAVCTTCRSIPDSNMRGDYTACRCDDSCAITYGNAPYYNNQAVANYISGYSGLMDCGDGMMFNTICVNTNFACSYVLAQIMGCWPNNNYLVTANAAEGLANCVGLGGLHCLVGRCNGCERLTGNVYRAFYCVSDNYPAVKVEITWTFVSNDYSIWNGSGSNCCACYGYKRQMVSSWKSALGESAWELVTCPFITRCYLVYPGHCNFNCVIFSMDSTCYLKPFNPRHSYAAADCKSNYGFGSGGLGITRFAVYRHCDGRNVNTSALRNCIDCYTCPVLKFYPFTQAGCSSIAGYSLDFATCCCGYYYYGGCYKLLGGSYCMTSTTIPTLCVDLAGSYYSQYGGWAIPMYTWRYTSASGCCFRNFPTGICIKSTLRNAPLSWFEICDNMYKGAAMCQLWNNYNTGSASWQTTFNMGNALRCCNHMLMPILICHDSWTIDPSICGCVSRQRARSGCHYVLSGLNCKCGPYYCNCTNTTCLYKNGSCCGAITTSCRYELAMGQCKQRTAAMCGSSTLPVTDQNGCYILGVDGTSKSITYTGSATCCKPLFWERNIQFYSYPNGLYWPSNYNV